MNLRVRVGGEYLTLTLLRESLPEVIEELNPKITGWRNYYAKVDPGVANQFLSKIDWYIRRRLLIFCRKKYKRWRRMSSNFFEVLKEIGLRSSTTWRSTYCAR